jgi:hypothetical protein
MPPPIQDEDMDGKSLARHRGGRAIRRTAMNRDWSYATRLADFFICWFTLLGLANVAVGLVSFKVDFQLSLFGAPITTVAQRFRWIAIYLAVATCGLSYIGWRQDWRYRVSELLSITGWLCVVFAGLLALPLISPIHAQIVVGGLGVSTVLCALAWACFRKGRK